MSARKRISPELRKSMIEEAAYYLALKRGAEGQDPVGDWLDAERDIDAKFTVEPHDERLERLLVRLSETNEKLRQLAKKVRDEAREEWGEDLVRVRQLRDELDAKLDEVRTKTGDARERARLQAEKTWQEIVEAFKKFRPGPE